MLALSRTAGYAILALSCMEAGKDRWVLARDIVSRVQVPGPYLAKILNALAKAGVIRAKRGYRGGFMLARPADQLSIAEIVTALEGPRWLDGCMLGFAECTDDRACPAHALCKSERAKVGAFLRKLTLRDVTEFELRHGTIPGFVAGGGGPAGKAVARAATDAENVRQPRRRPGGRSKRKK